MKFIDNSFTVKINFHKHFITITEYMSRNFTLQELVDFYAKELYVQYKQYYLDNNKCV